MNLTWKANDIYLNLLKDHIFLQSPSSPVYHQKIDFLGSLLNLVRALSLIFLVIINIIHKSHRYT
jgi:hypothetical protein